MMARPKPSTVAAAAPPISGLVPRREGDRREADLDFIMCCFLRISCTLLDADNKAKVGARPGGIVGITAKSMVPPKQERFVVVLLKQ
jgi:hypothetical protein